MLSPGGNHDKEMDGQADTGKASVWAVRSLQDQLHELMGYEKPPGVPARAYKLILDTHISRCRPPATYQRKPSPPDTEVLRRLAEIGEPSGEYTSDPLFWLLRVRRDIRKAALSSLDLQCGGELLGAAEIPKGNATAYRALASLAIRTYLPRGIQFGDSSLYCELFITGQVQSGLSEAASRTFHGKERAPRHWLYWLASVCGKPRSQTADIIRQAKLFGVRR